MTGGREQEPSCANLTSLLHRKDVFTQDELFTPAESLCLGEAEVVLTAWNLFLLVNSGGGKNQPFGELRVGSCAE